VRPHRASTTRRALVTALGAGAALYPLAQAAKARPRIGFVHPASVEESAVYRIVVPGLTQLGYVDGRSVELLLRSGKGQPDVLPALVDDLLRQNVDVLLAVGPASVRAAVTATRTVPVVAIDLESDPVRAGCMQSLARPGGNLTGFFLDLTGTGAKWLQLLREAVPGVHAVGLVWDASSGDAQLAATRAAAGAFGVEAHTIAIANWSELDAVLRALPSRTQALVVLSSPTAFQYSAKLAAYTLRRRVPAISPFRPFAQAGGLMSYGPDLDLFFQRVAPTLDKILRGARPAELAVEQPLKYDLVVNQRTGAALELSLPRSLLLRADEVIR
jgi:putative ABC transport system substrate-binding protein